MTKTNDAGQIVFRKLLYFYENKLPVHFKLNTGEFRNGTILDLSESKLTLVLKERVFGEMPFLLEEINPGTIKMFKEVRR
jgi:hypothetical protein